MYRRMDSSPAERPIRAGIAERLWDASRIEFSERGYHGARVQGIARRAGCNVALLYRHWPSKKGLYLELLRSIWLTASKQVATLMESGPAGAAGVVGAYLDAMMRDPTGSLILMREYLDGAPQLSQLLQAEPALMDRIRVAAAQLAANGSGSRPGLDPTLAVVTIGGIAAFAASAHETARIFVERPIDADSVREHLYDLLLQGILPRGAANDA